MASAQDLADHALLFHSSTAETPRCPASWQLAAGFRLTAMQINPLLLEATTSWQLVEHTRRHRRLCREKLRGVSAVVDLRRGEEQAQVLFVVVDAARLIADFLVPFA